MRKIVLTLSLLLSAISFGQIPQQTGTEASDKKGFCEDYNTPASLTNWKTFAAGTSIKPRKDSSDKNDSYLFTVDRPNSQSASYIFNDVDFSGDWRNFDDKCLCWDFNVFNDGGLGKPVSPRFTIIGGTKEKPLSATFVSSIQTKQGSGWIHVCAPVKLLKEGQELPSNSTGKWSMRDGDANKWNELLSNITRVRFIMDLTSSPTEEYGYDNICIQDCDVEDINEPTIEGAFCCDGENLVENGNFEAGFKGFKTSYIENKKVFPGSLVVSNNADAFNTAIKDHSFCTDNKKYVNNKKYLLVNGKTTQQEGTSAVIWEQNINVKNQKNYKFCANFKNLPQCTFDISPKIQFEIDGKKYDWQEINTSEEACDWLNISECFNAKSESVNIKIYLKEDGLGDGNDLAIDDIALQEKVAQDLHLTVRHQSNPEEILASVNTIKDTDDVLVSNNDSTTNLDQYYWFVFELNSFPFTSLQNNMTPNTFAWSSNKGGSSQSSGDLSNPWKLTTTFPEYKFDDNKLYIIGMYVPTNCGTCYDEAWSYQLTLNSPNARNFMGGLSPKMKEEIKAMFRSFTNNKLVPSKVGISNNKVVKDTTSKNDNNKNELKLYPNPVKRVLKVNKKLKEYSVLDVNGNTIFSKKAKTKRINVSNLSSGVYFLQATTNKDGKTIKKKFVKK